MIRNDLGFAAALALALAATLACGNASDSNTSPSNPAAGAGEESPAAEGSGSPGDGAEPPAPEAPAGGSGGASGEGSAAAPGGGEATGDVPAAAGGASGLGLDAGGAPSAPEGSTSVFPSDVTRPRIMIIGDSITAGAGCYKGYLLANLNQNGYSSFDFVGEYADDCGGGVRHSARSCTTAEQYTQDSFTLAEGSCNPSGTFPGLSPLMAEHQPDLLMIQLGVNDVWNGRSVEAILGDYATLVQQARAQNPDVVIALAQIHKIRPSGEGGDAVFTRAQELVEAVPAWVASQSQPGSPVLVADLWTNSDPALASDGVHPDDAGSQRMGLDWFNALSGILPAD